MNDYTKAELEEIKTYNFSYRAALRHVKLKMNGQQPECQHVRDHYAPPIVREMEGPYITTRAFKCKKCRAYYE